MPGLGPAWGEEVAFGCAYDDEIAPCLADRKVRVSGGCRAYRLQTPIDGSVEPGCGVFEEARRDAVEFERPHAEEGSAGGSDRFQMSLTLPEDSAAMKGGVCGLGGAVPVSKACEKR